jgi:hypothetical protein
MDTLRDSDVRKAPNLQKLSTAAKFVLANLLRGRSSLQKGT